MSNWWHTYHICHIMCFCRIFSLFPYGKSKSCTNLYWRPFWKDSLSWNDHIHSAASKRFQLLIFTHSLRPHAGKPASLVAKVCKEDSCKTARSLSHMFQWSYVLSVQVAPHRSKESQSVGSSAKRCAFSVLEISRMRCSVHKLVTKCHRVVQNYIMKKTK